MGLDMEIRRITKPELDSTKLYDISDLNCIVLNEDDCQKEMYAQLVPYCQKIRVMKHYYDYDTIRADYNLPSDARLYAYIGGVAVFGNGKQEVELPTSLLDEKYTIDKQEICYVCNCEDVVYWRKAYDIQDWFHEHLAAYVENTGFYILSIDTIKEFNRKFPEDKIPHEAPDEEQALFYWEWY